MYDANAIIYMCLDDTNTFCVAIFLKEHRSSHTRHADQPLHHQTEGRSREAQKGQGPGAVRPVISQHQTWMHQNQGVAVRHHQQSLRLLSNTPEAAPTHQQCLLQNDGLVADHVQEERKGHRRGPDHALHAEGGQDHQVGDARGHHEDVAQGIVV